MIRALITVLLITTPTGCSDNESSQSGACIAGKQDACACVGEGSGIQVCQADGTWGACSGCGVAPDAAGDATTDTPGDGDISSGDVTITDGATGDVPISEGCDPCGYGELKGVVCAPSEQIYIVGATIEMTVKDCDGTVQTLQTDSDADGEFNFPQVPCGQHVVSVEAGQFHREYVTVISPGHTTDITGAGHKECFQANTVKIAAFWGQWDRMHNILDNLGLAYTFYNFEFEWFNDTHPDDIEALQVLRDRTKLDAYDIIFFNCGSAALKWVNGFPEVKQNLRDWVLDGGSFYASDLAWAYLESAFPMAVDFYGMDDLPPQALDPDGPQQVLAHQQVPATVDDATLSQYIGTSSFTAEFGSGPLIAVAVEGAGTTVHVRGIVKIEDSSFQGWHTEGQPLVVSHKPAADSGRVIYTTFHNDDQADALMEKILNYLVFLL